MGQRSQIIISAPRIDYGKGNPNNTPRQTYILHSQWCYGVSFVRMMSDLQHALEYCIEQEADIKCASWTGRYGILNRAIRFACNRYVQAQVNFEEPDNSNVDKFENVSTQGKLVEHLTKVTDNNNGWGIVRIANDGKVSIAIINGPEDDSTIKVRSPLDYINLEKPSATNEGLIKTYPYMRESLETILLLTEEQGLETIRDFLFDVSDAGKLEENL